ncbi:MULTISPECIES: glycosyltransferase family 4 protein [Haloarcula]|uniref:glycosyltransferase family 4 protein n=1 Tax=Haloarcula TaxID=2237 RepID=UPI0024C24ACC|nr:glycosyltransferase family 4 protein [Halomicroarcula sp. YJ-61-S]
MRVLSLSLDNSILTDDGEPRQRQQAYAERLEEYTVVVKTDRRVETEIHDGALSVVPTRSRSRYHYLYDAYRLAARELSTREYDVVTTQTPFATGLIGWLLKRRFGVRLHTQVHIDFLNNAEWIERTPEHRVFDRIARFCLPRSDAIRVGTFHERTKIRRLVDEEIPVVVAPVSIDTESLVGETTAERRAEVSEEFDFGDRPVVLFAGRFVEQKDFATWMAVAERVYTSMDSSPVFVLTGDGPLHSDVRRRFEQQGMRDVIRMPGWVDRETLSALYDLADVFLITSHYEGTSRVIVEAGLNELPTVATPFAGAKDNISHGESGFIAEDVDQLAAYVQTVLTDAGATTAFGQAAQRQLADRFEREDLVESYVDFLSIQ